MQDQLDHQFVLLKSVSLASSLVGPKHNAGKVLFFFSCPVDHAEMTLSNVVFASRDSTGHDKKHRLLTLEMSTEPVLAVSHSIGCH